MSGQRTEGVPSQVEILLPSIALGDEPDLHAFDNKLVLAVSIDFRIAQTREKLRRKNQHNLLHAAIAHANIVYADWATAATQVENTLLMRNIGTVPYGEFLGILLGETANGETSYTKAIELYDRAESLRQFVRNKLQLLLATQQSRPLQENETKDVHQLLKLLRELQKMWENDVYLIVMEKVRNQEMANIFWVMDAERKGILVHHSHEEDIRKLGFTLHDHLSQKVLRNHYRRITKALSYTFIFGEGKEKVLGLSAEQALQEVCEAYARISQRLFPENITATDEWVLCKQDVFSPDEWYLADDLHTFAQKLTELSFVVSGRRVNMVALKDTLLRLDDSWLLQDVTREKINEDLHALNIPFESVTRNGERRLIPLSSIPLLWNKVRDIIDDRYGKDYYATLDSDEVVNWDKRHLQRMINQMITLDHIDPPSAAHVSGYLLDVYVLRDLVESLIAQPPNTTQDWRLAVFELLPKSGIKDFVERRYIETQKWHWKDLNALITELLVMYSGNRRRKTIKSSSSSFSLGDAMRILKARILTKRNNL